MGIVLLAVAALALAIVDILVFGVGLWSTALSCSASGALRLLRSDGGASGSTGGISVLDLVKMIRDGD